MNKFLSLFTALALGATTALPAQFEYRPNLPYLQRLLIQVDSGSAKARQDLERQGRLLVIHAAQYRVDLETAQTAAKISLLYGKPFTDADSEVPRRERFWRRGAVRSLRRILEVDSTNIWAAKELEEFEPYPHVWIEPARELLHLRALVAAHDALPVGLARAALGMELERGDAQRAMRILNTIDSTALSRADWDHLRAEVSFALGEELAGKYYYAGAAVIADSGDAEIYRADIAWLASEDELREWQSLTPGSGEHSPWLHRFWSRRDLEDVAMPGSRLATHFERWRLALNEYRWDLEGAHTLGEPTVPAMGIEYNELDVRFPQGEIPPAAATLANRFRSTSTVLDDRGAVVMRHGLPSAMANLPGVSGFGQAMLAWDTPTGRLVIGFSRPAMNSVVETPNAKFGMVARNMPMGDLYAGCEIDGDLCKLASRTLRDGASTESFVAAAMGQREIVRYTEMRETAESTDGNPEQVEQSLGAMVQAYGISGGGMLLSYAIPAKGLGKPGSVVQVRFKIVAGDSVAGTIVASTDTVRSWRLPNQIPDGAFLGGWFESRLPIGEWRVGIFIADSSGKSGTADVERSVVAIDTLLPGINVGDPILGRPSGGLSWRRFGGRVPLNPTGAWRLDERAVLTVELYGLTPGTTYKQTIEVWDTKTSADEPRLAISSPYRAAKPTAVITRDISFESLRAGDYRLVFRITDPETGQSVARSRNLPLLKKEKREAK